jgi:hypothetical protein
MRRSRWLASSVLLVAASMCVSGCGDPSTAATSRSLPTHLSSRGFAVGWVPRGFAAPRWEVGSRPAVLSDDSFGGVEPFLVVAPDGWDGDPDAVAVVTLVDGSSNEGGLEQALPDYLGVRHPTTLGHHQAWIYRGTAKDATGRTIPRQVVVRLDGERGVRVISRGVAVATLEQIARRASLASRRPVLAEPPQGWSVVSQLGAEATAVLDATWYAWPPRQHLLPASGARAGTWTRGEDELQVLRVDGSASDLDAAGLVRLADWAPQREPGWTVARVDGSWLAEHREGPGLAGGAPVRARRELTTLGRDGGLVAVEVSGPRLSELPSVADLRRVAAGVRTDQAAWDRAVAEASRRPPRPTAPAVALARGEVDGVAWLLQSDPGPTTSPVARVDPQLHLTGGRTLYGSVTSVSGAGPGWRVHQLDDADGQAVPFTATLVLVGPDVAQVASAEGAPKVATRPAPGGRFALVMPAWSTGGPPLLFDAAGRRLQ